MNKYLDDDETDSDLDDDIDIHEIVREGTFDEVKEAIALDRPRLIALKDEVISRVRNYNGSVLSLCISMLYRLIESLFTTLPSWTRSRSPCF
jgi:hypothetical protein